MQALTPTSIRPPNGPELYPAQFAGELRWLTAEELGRAQHRAAANLYASDGAFADAYLDSYKRYRQARDAFFRRGPFGF